jgi:phosphoribosyl-ATP pyrophosphohydrolase/phosphoribosyl-AMP cyclohydrolase
MTTSLPIRSNTDAETLAWDKMEGGLLPAVVQDADTRQVLMLGYMNREALQETLRSGFVTFYSRSKERLWMKGESSQNRLKLVAATSDCDADALLIEARPEGPTCHTGTTSCFGPETAPGAGFLAHLERVIESRRTAPVESSYVAKLFARGIDRMAQKVGEEGVETVIAAKNDDAAEFKGEASDLLFHLLVLTRAKGFGLSDLIETLRTRHAK